MLTTPVKKLKLRLPLKEWERLRGLATQNHRSVNSEIVTAIETYTRGKHIRPESTTPTEPSAATTPEEAS